MGPLKMLGRNTKPKRGKVNPQDDNQKFFVQCIYLLCMYVFLPHMYFV